jgi:hypothetical protein
VPFTMPADAIPAFKSLVNFPETAKKPTLAFSRWCAWPWFRTSRKCR